MRHLRAPLLVGVALLLAAACSGGSNAGTLEADEVPETAVPPEETTTTEAAPSFTATASWSWSFETRDGYTQEGTLRVGDIGSLDDAPALPGLTPDVTSVCDIDPQRDGVIPATLELENTTERFATHLSVNLYKSYRFADSVTLEAATEYSSGPNCDEISTSNDAFFGHGGSLGLGYDEDVPPGQSRGPKGYYVILSDYFTPSSPNGDRGKYDAAVLALVPTLRTDQAKLVAFSGTDATFEGTWEMALDGTLPGD